MQLSKNQKVCSVCIQDSYGCLQAWNVTDLWSKGMSEEAVEHHLDV